MANLQIRVNVGRSTSFHYINSNLLIWGPMVSPRFVPNNQTTTKQLFVTCVWTRQLLTIGCHYFPPGLQPLVAEVSTTRISWRLQRHSWSGGLAETRRRRVSCCRRAVCHLCTCENGRCASQARLWGRQCRRWNPRVQTWTPEVHCRWLENRLWCDRCRRMTESSHSGRTRTSSVQCRWYRSGQKARTARPGGPPYRTLHGDPTVPAEPRETAVVDCTNQIVVDAEYRCLRVERSVCGLMFKVWCLNMSLL